MRLVLRQQSNAFRQPWCGNPFACDGSPSGAHQKHSTAAISTNPPTIPGSRLNVPQPYRFDFPGRKLPVAFHYTGPFVDRAARKEISFLWSQLDSSRPLVFVSMGTLQNGIKKVYRVIAETCAEFPVQTVLALGGNLAPEALGPLPGDRIIARYAPQLDLLRKSALTVFHGVLNTALESLSYGVPMIAIPITFDQPGVGTRLLWTGTGKAIPVHELKSCRPRAAIREVLGNGRYRAQAKALQRQIASIRGVERAAELVERSLAISRPPVPVA
jgi:zeaxanthin glucosyltransferase